MHAIRVATVACLAVALGACASAGEYRARQDARLATYEKYAGEPVRIKEWWPGTESNRRHGDFQSPALPTELPGH